MADWGPFVKGLAGTLPQIGFQTYALRQRDEALARQEKQLSEQIKKQEINEAQQSLYKGLEWSEKLSDDVKPQLIDSMIVPAIKTLTKHNIMSYNDEQVIEFATKLKGNVTVGGQFMKDFKNIIDLNTDKKTGSVNYKEILKGIDMLLPTYGKKLTENEMKVAEIQKQNVARQGVTDPNTSPEDKKLLNSYLPKAAQDALSPEAEKKPDMVKQYEYAQGQGYKGSFVQFKKELRAAQGGGDVAAQTLKNEKFVNALEKQADSEAAREARMKYNTQPTLQQGPDGKIVMSFPNSPEAHQFYLSRKKELTDKKITRAVEKKALPKEYKVEPTEVPKPQSATPIDTEEGLRTYLKSAGADEKYINDYVKRAKEQKKIK